MVNFVIIIGCLFPLLVVFICYAIVYKDKINTDSPSHDTKMDCMIEQNEADAK